MTEPGAIPRLKLWKCIHARAGKETERPGFAKRQGTEALVQDLVAASVDELAEVRTMLDSRYDDLKSGRVKPIDGEAFFGKLPQREDDLLNRSPE